MKKKLGYSLSSEFDHSRFDGDLLERLDEDDYLEDNDSNAGLSEEAVIEKFLKLNREVEETKRLRREMPMVDTTPNTDDLTGLSHDENERTREVMEGDMATIPDV